MVPWDQLSPEERARYGTPENYMATMTSAAGTAFGGDPSTLSAPASAPAPVADRSYDSVEDVRASRSGMPVNGSAPPPVSAPPDPTGTGGAGGVAGAPLADPVYTGSPSGSYTSGGGSGGSSQSTPGPSHERSQWSEALHQSGALENPRANPIPFGSAPGADTGMFDPYLRNTQGMSAGANQGGGGVPPVSMPPDPTAGAAPAPMTNFDPGAQPRVAPQQVPPVGVPAGPGAPAPVAAPVQPQVGGATMTPEEIRLRYQMMNKGMSQNYGAY